MGVVNTCMLAPAGGETYFLATMLQVLTIYDFMSIRAHLRCEINMPSDTKLMRKVSRLMSALNQAVYLFWWSRR